jgi:hypothetical protein
MPKKAAGMIGGLKREIMGFTFVIAGKGQLQ